MSADPVALAHRRARDAANAQGRHHSADDLFGRPTLEIRRRAVMADHLECPHYLDRTCNWRRHGVLVQLSGEPCVCLAAAAEEAWSMA